MALIENEELSQQSELEAEELKQEPAAQEQPKVDELETYKAKLEAAESLDALKAEFSPAYKAMKDKPEIKELVGVYEAKKKALTEVK